MRLSLDVVLNSSLLIMFVAELFVPLTNSDSVVFNGSMTVVVENKVEFIVESVIFVSSRVVGANVVLFIMGSVVF